MEMLEVRPYWKQQRRSTGGVSFNGSVNIDLPGVNTSCNQDDKWNRYNEQCHYNSSTDETVYLTFVDASSGNKGVEVDAGSPYNPSSGLINTGALTTTDVLSLWVETRMKYQQLQ